MQITESLTELCISDIRSACVVFQTPQGEFAHAKMRLEPWTRQLREQGSPGEASFPSVVLALAAPLCLFRVLVSDRRLCLRWS